MSPVTKLLIVSLTPQNIERGDLWFSENTDAIKKAAWTNLWWRDNAIFVEKDLVIKPSLLVRRLVDFGYERAPNAAGKGIFAPHGGMIDVWPLNAAHPYTIEFSGNTVQGIYERDRPPREAKPRLYRGLASIEGMTPGSFIVHTDHGIGIFRGIQETSAPATPRSTLEIPLSSPDLYQQIADDRPRFVDINFPAFYKIEYAAPAPGREPDMLLVPTNQKGRLTPYVGFTTPVIHRLGGALWLRTKRKVREDAEKLAHSLFSLYQARHRATRPSYHYDPSFLETLHGTFKHEETDDQCRAENEIMSDLSRERPMDRLLVGDVGFGKTEIAIRAAAAVITGGRQVAVLAPTTVLAAQHERTFRERLEPLAITVSGLSRLTKPDEGRTILKKLAQGGVDCVIGTSRLLSQDVAFKNLGMVIIDEEQRFGVKQKEKCKEFRADVDVLSLSATPIPRTLSLALARLRDISRLDTPPPSRLAIATSVLPYGTKLIRDAVAFEIARGGQVYFLHNRVETIAHAGENLQKILHLTKSSDRKQLLSHQKMPHIGILHGKMSEETLLETMGAFRNHEIDILLATTIIENGLDISRANTLIVDDATRLGLAQAHQLRGRIGRGDTQAFAYFLYKPRHLTERAAKRLDALKEYAELGSGYEIALRDLEIRGAGNVFGREQSGAINKVGLNLYCQMIAASAEETGYASEADDGKN